MTDELLKCWELGAEIAVEIKARHGIALLVGVIDDDKDIFVSFRDDRGIKDSYEVRVPAWKFQMNEIVCIPSKVKGDLIEYFLNAARDKG